MRTLHLFAGAGGESLNDESLRVLRSDVHIQAGTGDNVQPILREPTGVDFSWWQVEPDVGRVANGIPKRVDRLKALGNGQVPAQAALAWRILTA